ncbi:Borealin N terminal-domain-containing protein [Daldinia decipiens]|uniref:Borealin N terminal-domain-containing protein n=1 Tax=Daldinia decipiens TaxID=326647 RepID=UPI0020C40ADE|nr:Borealin N terminal-domain-containing protein [Daldinia decipiens]KAI1657136.1 Borealin N terminal-domain-containing protein [Daldinia decipiens]
MAPVKATRKRKSEAITGSIKGQKIHTIRCSPERSPIKKRKLGLSLAQKQALIDNLQLEITERARRLRAQYNIQAQHLRSRVEMRVNRIPTALRKLKMGELLSKSLQPQQPPRPPKSTYVARPPPVPAKDGASAKPLPRKPVPAVIAKGLSEEILGLDKENQGDDVQNPKKRPAAIQPGQILSPTSSNTRIVPRARPAVSPMKTLVSRPASPMKGPPPKPSSNIISSMSDRVKASRPAVTRKPTTSSMTSSANGNASVRARQAAVPSRPPTAASTRGRRKASTTSESSNGSSTTVLKKTTASRAAKTTAPAAKKTVMGTIKSATTKKPPATKAAASGTGTGRTLRKRA